MHRLKTRRLPESDFDHASTAVSNELSALTGTISGTEMGTISSAQVDGRRILSFLAR
jgi:hypothetical protein